MRIHVRREYGADGPYSLEQIRDMVDNGAVTFGDIVWVEGTEEWVPLNQVEGIYLRPAPEIDASLVEEGPQTRPWVRYWARWIDIGFIESQGEQQRRKQSRLRPGAVAQFRGLVKGAWDRVDSIGDADHVSVRTRSPLKRGSDDVGQRWTL